MSEKIAIIKKGKYTPVVFSGWPLEESQSINRMSEHSRFQRDTHFEQEIDPANINFEMVEPLNEK